MSVNVNFDEAKNKLNSKQVSAISLLARGHNQKQVAQEIGVNEATISRWKRDPAFHAALREMENELYNDALNMLKKTLLPAITCLVRNMTEARPHVQVVAASKLIDSAIEVHKVHSLEGDLSDLERIIKDLKR